MAELQQHEGLPLVWPLPAGTTAVEAFRRLWHRPYCLFLDSSLPLRGLGEASYVAADPFEHVVVANSVKAEGLARVDEWLSTYASALHPELPPFQGGVAGLFGYELGRCFERLPLPRFDEFQLPQAVLGAYDVVVAFDERQERGWIVSQGFPEVEPDRRRKRAERRLMEFRNWLEQSPTEPDIALPTSSPQPIAAPCLETSMAGLYSNFSRAQYQDAVARAIEYIRAGDVFQVNLSQRLLCRAREHPMRLYCRLRTCTAAPFSGYFDAGTFQVVSASPERFLRVHGADIEARPIKGTRRRTRQPEADLYSADDLVASPKDRAENIMIVDLLRNDLSRVCRPESIRVPQLCGLEDYGYVQHLVSAVRGELLGTAGPLEWLQAAFPGGSVTGAPKVRAMEIITELEQVARGAYCGSLGYLGWNGVADLSILIRTITHCGGWWHLPVGGGITTQSDPRAEWEETWHKAAGLLSALA